MLHEPPPKKQAQDVHSVILDLERQAKTLQDSVGWMKNIATQIQQIGSRGSVHYRLTTPLSEETRWANVAFMLPVDRRMESVGVFTVAGTYSPKELHAMLDDDLASIEALRMARAQQHWKQFAVRPFDVWTVDKPFIWQGSLEHTTVWLNQVVQDWVSYWFKLGIAASVAPEAFHVERVGSGLIDQYRQQAR